MRSKCAQELHVAHGTRGPAAERRSRPREGTGTMTRYVRRLAALTAAAAAIATALTGATAAQAADTAAVPHSRPAWLSRATHLGAATGATRVTATIDLAPRGGEAALDAFLASVSTPGSASYRHFLTRAEYRRRFAPADSAVAAIRAFATKGGFTVDAVAADNASITVSGTAAKADAAFGAALQRYRHDGQTVTAPSRTLRLPAAVARQVLGVRGLDTTTERMKPAATNVPPPAGYRNSTLCSSAYGQKPATTDAKGAALPKFEGKTIPYSPCGYTGAQLRKAYEKGSTLTGRGVGVAVVDAYASPTIASDAASYAKRHGDPAYTAGQLGQSGVPTYTDTDDCDASGWFGEETLDIEAVHAMAPGAAIRYYAARSCGNADLLSALTKAVNDPKVDIVSNSYGTASELVSSTSGYESLFKKAAALGVTVLFSSGDSGDSAAAVGFKTVGYPASSPNVTSVGGTATEIRPDGTLGAQTGWGTEQSNLSGGAWKSQGFIYGAGGGSSSVFAKPSYQSAVSGSGRQVPDVAMDADPTTGMLIGQTQTFKSGVAYGEYRIGGTSLASPLLAGMTALAVQKSGPAGFINPTVYAKRTAFTDVTAAFPDPGNVRGDFTNGEDASGGYTYSVRSFGDDSSLAVKAGYDQVTGVGVPNLAYLSIFG